MKKLWAFLLAISLTLTLSATTPLPGDGAVSPAAGDQSAPAIAPGNGTLLAVWSDNRSNPYGGYEYETSRDIYGMRLSSNGTPLDALPFAVCAARATQNYPKVAWNGSNWLVVFETTDQNGTGYYQTTLAVVRVAPSGQVLDPQPIPLHGLAPSGVTWDVASDGTNWVIVCETTSTSSDIVATRISPAGLVLDPPNRALVKATYYLRFNLKLVYAAGVFLLTFDDSGTKGVRFDSNLNLLDAAPIQITDSGIAGIAANPTGFYIVWNRQNPDYSVVLAGSRLNTAGVKLDGTNGVSISGSKQPYAYDPSAVTWDGVNWRATWGDYTNLWVARINPSGTVLDAGSVKVAGPRPGLTAGNGSGGVQLVWTSYTNSNYDTYTANIAANNIAGPNRCLSTGAPQQIKPDIATSGAGYMLVYRSATSAEARVLAQPLDAAGTATTPEPVQLDLGANFNGPGTPNVAWSSVSSLYLVAWGRSNGVAIQRLSSAGVKIDPAPVIIRSNHFGAADVAAIGDTFLITTRKYGYTPQYIDAYGTRVRGSDGAVLDTLLLGGGYVSRPPAVTTLGGKFYAAFISNWTHDNSGASTVGVLVPTTGTNLTSSGLYTFSTAGGNGIIELGLDSSGDKALLVQSAEVTSGVENDMIGWLISTNGAASAMINFTPWSGNQYRPHVSWDGANFIIAYQEQKNRLAPWTIDQLDARSDLFAMRVSPTGTKLDPQGFVFSASPAAETDPTVCAVNGTMLLAGAVMMNDSSFANYRILYDLKPGNRPVAVINASTNTGDVPLTVNFDSGNPFGAPMFYAWNFGDGGTSTLPNPSHTFTVAGEYLVTLTVTDEFGRQTTQAQMINATKPNQIPVAIATANKYSGTAPLDVILSAASSYDPDGPIGNIEWRFSDGGYTYGATAYHTFTTPGLQTVTLLCYDGRGGIGTTNLTINLTGANQAPVAHAAATPSSGSAPLTVQFSSAGSTDPDGTIVEYYWTFGDAFGVHSYDPNPIYSYGYAGTYTATLTVWDNNNVPSAPVNVVITVGPDPTTTLRSTAINLSSTTQGKKVNVTGNVTVKDLNGTPVSGASVTATWTKPGGVTVGLSATTSATGIAKFSTSGARGTYTLTVNDIYKYLYTFDAAGSVLTKSIGLLPALKLSVTGPNVVLSWPTNDAGFALQSAIGLGEVAVWNDVPQMPVVNGTNFTVTLPATNSGGLYRLIQP